VEVGSGGVGKGGLGTCGIGSKMGCMLIYVAVG
jgi:hypothetical protein